jgi:hypothetical protein
VTAKFSQILRKPGRQNITKPAQVADHKTGTQRRKPMQGLNKSPTQNPTHMGHPQNVEPVLAVSQSRGQANTLPFVKTIVHPMALSAHIKNSILLFPTKCWHWPAAFTGSRPALAQSPFVALSAAAAAAFFLVQHGRTSFHLTL